MPYDGRRSLDAPRCYLEPDFLPRDLLVRLASLSSAKSRG